MTKIICVNQNKLGKIVGYGFWSFITCGLVLMLMFTVIESLDRSGAEINEWNNHLWICYHSYLFEEKECYFEKSWWHEFKWAYGVWGFSNGINFFFLGLWFYYKQQTFKFSWCKKPIAHEDTA